MTIINANTSSMNVLNACKENCKLGEEIREGGREGGGKEEESKGKGGEERGGESKEGRLVG